MNNELKTTMNETFNKARIVTAAMFAVTILALLFTACTSNSNGFSIEGRLLSMNQADFYVYSPDGAIQGVDTIHVQGGRFIYEKAVAQKGTVVIVFPNFVMLPVFVEPGASIDIDGNAAHLSATEITGTDDNELFTQWRKDTEKMSPPEMKRQAEHFIHDHPESTAAQWLLLQHFITCAKPDYKKARTLLKEITQKSNGNIGATRLMTAMSNVGGLGVDDHLPSFTAKDIKGRQVSSATFMQGTSVIILWSSWNYDSQNLLRQVANKQASTTDSTKFDHVLAICLDADTVQCMKSLRNNNATELTTVCDGKMWESPLLHTLGLNNMPDNIKLRNGKVITRSVPTNTLLKR